MLPLREWYAVKNELLEDIGENHSAVLTADCNFSHIFCGPKKTLPFNSMERPVSELVYSRSDFDGSKWWTTWFHCQDEKPERGLALEVDTFQQALFKLPEFHTLWSMQIMCPLYAEATSDRTEYNLYSQTERFYIWLRLITRERDYNVYVHYYLKSLEQISK